MTDFNQEKYYILKEKIQKETWLFQVSFSNARFLSKKPGTKRILTENLRNCQKNGGNHTKTFAQQGN